MAGNQRLICLRCFLTSSIPVLYAVVTFKILNGSVFSKDLFEARKYYMKSAKQGNPTAQTTYAGMCNKGKGAHSASSLAG
jgi:TPR repeat protein